MRKKANCIVEGCDRSSFARGYCRRHYGQIWRRGMIYDSPRRESDFKKESPMERDDRDEKLRTLERELKKAQQLYAVVVGFQGRLKWRRKIEAVQEEISKITEAQEEKEKEKTKDAAKPKKESTAAV